MALDSVRLAESMVDNAFLALVILLALAFYVAARGIHLKHQREIIARLEDLRQRHEAMELRMGNSTSPLLAIEPERITARDQ